MYVSGGMNGMSSNVGIWTAGCYAKRVYSVKHPSDVCFATQRYCGWETQRAASVYFRFMDDVRTI